MAHRVTLQLNSSSAHSLRVVELAIASVWAFFILLADAQEMRDVFHRRSPAMPAGK